MVDQLFRNQVMSTKVAYSVRETAAFPCVVSDWSVKTSADRERTEEGFSPSTAGRYRSHHESTSRAPCRGPGRMFWGLHWSRIIAIRLPRGFITEPQFNSRLNYRTADERFPHHLCTVCRRGQNGKAGRLQLPAGLETEDGEVPGQSRVPLQSEHHRQ